MAKVIWVSTKGRSAGSGTAGDPLLSIQDAVDRARPDTTIMVKAGLYTENLAIRTSGTDAAPIRLVSADGPGLARIRPAFDSVDTVRVMGAEHVTIDGFTVEPSARNGIHISSVGDMSDLPRHVTVMNCTVLAGPGDGVKVSQGDFIRICDNRIMGSLVEQGIDMVGVRRGAITGNDVSGVQGHAAIQVKGGSVGVLIEDNLVHDSARWGILVGGGTSEGDFRPGFIGANAFEARAVTVVGNEVRDVGQQALRVMGAQTVEVTGNWFHDVGSQRFVDMVTSPDHDPPWRNADVSFVGNSFDRARWLVVESGRDTLLARDNRTDGLEPRGWDGAGLTPTSSKQLDSAMPDASAPAPGAPASAASEQDGWSVPDDGDRFAWRDRIVGDRPEGGFPEGGAAGHARPDGWDHLPAPATDLVASADAAGFPGNPGQHGSLQLDYAERSIDDVPSVSDTTADLVLATLNVDLFS